MAAGFWKGKRVFVTGHTGFKGGWLSLWLQMQGAEVCGYSLKPPTEPNLFTIVNVSADIQSHIADIRDAKQLKGCMQNFEPDAVFHLAAQALVRESYVAPTTTYETNVIGLVNLLEAVRNTPSVSSVVIVTSDKCYENREWVWGYRENEAMGGYDPYSSSKGCAELVTSAYRKSFFSADEHGPRIASARAGNVVGGGDWAVDRLVPDLIRAFISGEKALLRHPNAVRPWQHVLEPLSGYLLLAEKLVDNEDLQGGWNFGPEQCDTMPVSSIADRICEAWGAGASWTTDDATHPHEAHTLRLDCSKARSELGWRPRLGLRQTLDLTLEWYKAYQHNKDMRAVTEGQIQNYIGRG